MSSSSVSRVIAVFDFDGTLAKGDSLWPFLLRASGIGRCTYALVRALFARAFASRDRDGRTVFKEALLYHALRGKPSSALAKPAEAMRGWPRWINRTVASLRKHHAKGHHVLIATGGLSLYVPQMLSSLPYDGLLATEMEVHEGILTGHMLSGNCVRQRKAQRVGEYLAKHGPFDDVWVYGNAPHDLPMMEWAQHKVII